MAEPFTTRHRGPYLLCVCRPHPKKGKTFSTSEWLPGSVDGCDVQDECKALLTDPRDTIVSVSVWSEHEEQYVATFTASNLD